MLVKQMINSCRDLSIPPLESTMKEYQGELTKLQALVTSQVLYEQNCRQANLKQAKPLPRATEPPYASSIYALLGLKKITRDCYNGAKQIRVGR